ncbi:MAG: DUF504 domain-containing protein [Nanoarchaeota archaeon]|nr:DUF504 domain-containing protein [Nanoarchaeota archaeon]MBU1644535.1 DUF504 domain-containing protein [Nanoarchaeota archaeon]MBU1976828.1 DUF504 domain-containing protein [Nanoarchaeota archaeon]
MFNFEKIKKYFWYLFGVMGVVFFWAGVWDGIGTLSYLQNPLISLIVGLVMLSLSGLIFKGTSPFWEKGDPVGAVLHKVHTHPKKHEFHIKYYDKIKKKLILLEAKKIKNIEKDTLVFLEKGKKEVFIPFHRVEEILHKNKTHWKK